MRRDEHAARQAARRPARRINGGRRVRRARPAAAARSPSASVAKAVAASGAAATRPAPATSRARRRRRRARTARGGGRDELRRGQRARPRLDGRRVDLGRCFLGLRSQERTRNAQPRRDAQRIRAGASKQQPQHGRLHGCQAAMRGYSQSSSTPPARSMRCFLAIIEHCELAACKALAASLGRASRRRFQAYCAAFVHPAQRCDVPRLQLLRVQPLIAFRAPPAPNPNIRDARQRADGTPRGERYRPIAQKPCRHAAARRASADEPMPPASLEQRRRPWNPCRRRSLEQKDYLL